MKWLRIEKDSFRKDCLPAASLAHDRILQLDDDIGWIMPNKSEQHTKIIQDLCNNVASFS